MAGLLRTIAGAQGKPRLFFTSSGSARLVSMLVFRELQMNYANYPAWPPKRAGRRHPLALSVALCFGPVSVQSAHAQSDTIAAPRGVLAPVEIKGNYDNAVGSSDAASQGRISSRVLETRPAMRPGEVLEFIPGMIVTQHSSDGKANQYFLRGFNLDHGTDFQTSVDGIQVNMPTHGHGQGYTDLNFLIPELIDRIDYRKGPYGASTGDFGSAGSASLVLRDRLSAPFAQATLGANGYRRLLAAGSPMLANGATLLGALEVQGNDGPWEVPEALRRFNAVLRYSQGSKAESFRATAMFYRARWTATDQIPERAVASGALGRFGSLDPTTGGATGRDSVSLEWRKTLADGSVRAQVYGLRYDLDLYSNFTYFQANPMAGDQFLQRDRRQVVGGQASRVWFGEFGARPTTTELGLQLRHDRIRVGLFDSQARQITQSVRDDRVLQTSAGLFAENTIAWTPWLRSVAGLRIDRFQWDVRGEPAQNSGRSSASLVSPKFSLIMGPWARTEFFANTGRGFHSNDGRATVIRVDPRTGEPVASVPGLVRTLGSEIGVRSEWLPGLQSSLALWQLDIGSELVFVGDAGTTEPSRPSRRAGVEWNNRYVPRPWLLFDLDLAVSRARFTQSAPEGDQIPGAVRRVASAAVSVRDIGPWSGSVQLRHLGARPLSEDGSVLARSTTLVNLRVAYRVSKGFDVSLDVFNLLGRKVNDVEYYYASQLRGEAAPVDDRHFHPAESRVIRVTLRSSL